MKRDIDPYGRTRFIESEHDNGKPRIWYQYRTDDALMRHENNGFGISIELAVVTNGSDLAFQKVNIENSSRLKQIS